MSFAACSCMAATTLGWQWPRLLTAMPATQSTYSFPFTSHTRAPLPLVRTMGWRPYDCTTCLASFAIASSAESLTCDLCAILSHSTLIDRFLLFKDKKIMENHTG